MFTPEVRIKHGQREFVAFVPYASKGHEGGEGVCKMEEREEIGFVRELCNGEIELGAGKLSSDLLSQAALRNTKVTVIVSQQHKCERCLELKALVVPAE